MRPAAHPLDALDADGNGRGVPQLESDAEQACRERWRQLNALDVPTIEAHRSRE